MHRVHCFLIIFVPCHVLLSGQQYQLIRERGGGTRPLHSLAVFVGSSIDIKSVIMAVIATDLGRGGVAFEVLRRLSVHRVRSNLSSGATI